MSCSKSLTNTTKRKIPLAKIGRTRGLKGQVRLEIYNPNSELFEPGAQFHIDGGTGFESLILTEFDGRWSRFQEIQNETDARKIVNAEIFLYREELPSPGENQYYEADLIGCDVRHAETEKKIGILKTVMHTVSNDIWVIETPDGELLMPLIKDVLIRVDLKNRILFVQPPEIAHP